MKNLTQRLSLDEFEEGRAPTLAEARRLLDPDLFRHRAPLYWADMLLSAAIGWSALAAAALDPRLRLETAVLVVIAAFAFLRALLFIHEICHFKRGVLPGFTAVWNLVVGIPMMVPAFTYTTHLDHHRRPLYGTAADPEYLPLAHMGRLSILAFLVETLFVPALLVLRFGVLGPLSWILPPLRRLVEARMSSLVVNPSYARRRPESAERWRWIGVEFLIFLWIAGVAALIATGRLSIGAFYVWYLVAALVAFVNQVRTLAAHRYENEGESVDTATQLLDSVNVRGLPFLTELVFPVGLKYHALHHFVPDMPYHGLAQAHRILMARLPEGSRYRETEEPTGLLAIAHLWRDAAGRRGRPSAWGKKEESA
jgi:fatty acid desaturase